MNNKKTSNFSERLKLILLKKNLSQAELSKMTNITASSISDWLKNKYEAKQDKIDIIATKLNINKAWLMGYDVPINSQEDDKTEDEPTPTQFTTTKEAIEFLMNQNIIAANTGINISDYTEDEITQFANRLLDYARFLDNDKKMDR